MPPRNRTWLTPRNLWEQLKPAARQLRREQTPAEATLWNRLRRRQLSGLAFRRQHALSRYIVDFYCPRAQVVVEVDGEIHDGRSDEDRIRQNELERLGMIVLRFRNERVSNDLANVLEEIQAACIARIAELARPSHARKKPTVNEPR